MFLKVPLLPLGDDVQVTLHAPEAHWGLKVHTDDPPLMGLSRPFWEVTFKVIRNWPLSRAESKGGLEGEFELPPPLLQAASNRLNATRGTRMERIRILTYLPGGTLT